MDPSKPLEILFSEKRSLILRTLFREPERWWSVSDLAGSAGLESGSLRRVMKGFLGCGIIREKQESGISLLQPNPFSPIFTDLLSLVAKLTVFPNVETILVVEDQPATAQITRILLESWGYRVLEAHGGPEAIRIFEDDGETIRLLLTDVLMPDMTGTELANELVGRRPQLRVIFMSGCSPNEVSFGGVPFLSKPFNPASLSRIVRKELDRSNLMRRSTNSRVD